MRNRLSSKNWHLHYGSNCFSYAFLFLNWVLLAKEEDISEGLWREKKEKIKIGKTPHQIFAEFSNFYGEFVGALSGTVDMTRYSTNAQATVWQGMQ